jgi:hypothetical protein
MSKKKKKNKTPLREMDPALLSCGEDVSGYVMILLTKGGQLLVTSKDVDATLMQQMITRASGIVTEEYSDQIHPTPTVH